VPEQVLVVWHVPVPYGVEHEGLTQHSMSELPEQYPEYFVPVLQHPAEIDTQTPSVPETVQVDV
jgi:hypothetical protein